jgi:hypothetical protein
MNIDPRPTCKRAVRFYLPGMSSRNCRSLFTNHGPKSVIIEDEREFCASHSDSIGRPRALPVLSIAVDAGGVGQISRTPVRRWPGNPSSVLFIRADHAAIAGSMIFNRIAAEQTSRCSEAQPTCRLPEDSILPHSPGGTAVLKFLASLRTFCYDCFVGHFRRSLQMEWLTQCSTATKRVESAPSTVRRQQNTPHRHSLLG